MIVNQAKGKKNLNSHEKKVETRLQKVLYLNIALIRFCELKKKPIKNILWNKSTQKIKMNRQTNHKSQLEKNKNQSEIIERQEIEIEDLVFMVIEAIENKPRKSRDYTHKKSYYLREKSSVWT